MCSGSNFGPDCARSSASLAAGRWPLTLLTCTHSRLTCRVPPGAGRNLFVTLTVANQAITFSQTNVSYAPPSISMLSGDTLLPSTGFSPSLNRWGQVVIQGSNFGPSSTALVVTYSGSECAIVCLHSFCGYPHSLIVCLFLQMA